MRESPQGQNLLAIARSTLLDKVVPLLPQDQRYNALMVANAIAIAMRQWEAGDAWQQEELARLQALLGDSIECVKIPADAPGQTERDTVLPATLRAANHALAQRIRSGEFDAPSQPAAELLEWMATQRVRESAPKVLLRTGSV